MVVISAPKSLMPARYIINAVPLRPIYSYASSARGLNLPKGMGWVPVSSSQKSNQNIISSSSVMGNLLRVNHIARTLGISNRAVIALCDPKFENDPIPHFKLPAAGCSSTNRAEIIRVRPDEFNAWLERHRRVSPPVT